MIINYLIINWTTLLTYSFALIGLIWQVRSISEVYFNYETLVDISIGVSNEISMPGLTICVPIDDQLSNYNLPDTNEFLMKLEKFSTSLSSLSAINIAYLPINLIGQLPSATTIYCDVPANELDRLNTSLPWTCENIVQPKVTIQYTQPGGMIARCVTYFYRNSTEKPLNILTSYAKDFFHLEITSKQPRLVSIFVHNPSRIFHVSDADTITFSTEELNEMVLSTSKFETNMLPPPYRTDCRTYSEFEGGQYGCIFDCWIKETITRCPVWSIYSPASINVTLPFLIDKEKANISLPCHVRDKNICFKKCYQPQCDDIFYSTNNIYEKRSIWSLSNQNRTSIYIRRPIGVELKYSYKPHIAPIEYVCYITSSLALWFGISFINVYQLIVNWFQRSKLPTPKIIPIKPRKVNSK